MADATSRLAEIRARLVAVMHETEATQVEDAVNFNDHARVDVAWLLERVNQLTAERDAALAAAYQAEISVLGRVDAEKAMEVIADLEAENTRLKKQVEWEQRARATAEDDARHLWHKTNDRWGAALDENARLEADLSALRSRNVALSQELAEAKAELEAKDS